MRVEIDRQLALGVLARARPSSLNVSNSRGFVRQWFHTLVVSGVPKLSAQELFAMSYFGLLYISVHGCKFSCWAAPQQ